MSSSTAPTERPRITACIIAFNEAARIGDCLASLAFCDEIVVVDSYSSDATVAIAEAAGARVLQRTFDGFRSQKAYCVEQARHDWVLCLDADERVGTELRHAIEQARDTGFDGAAGYRFARLSEYFGRFLRHAIRFLAAETVEWPLQHAGAGSFGKGDGGIGGERIHHHDLVAERQRGQTVTDATGFVERDNAG